MLAFTPEDHRLRALHALNLLDTEPEKEFDVLVALAAELLDCPTSLLSLIDRDRQWIKAGCGTDLRQTARDIAFCDHTIRGDDPMVVTNSSADPRFCDSPLVTGENFQFYAGVPIRVPNPDGVHHAIGSLCVLDHRPRQPSEQQIEALRRLGTLAEALITARGTATEAVAIAESAQEQARLLRRQDRIFHKVERLAAIGSWRFVLADSLVVWSEGVYRIHEIDPQSEPDLNGALDHFPPRDRAIISDALTRTIETGEPFQVEVDFITAKNRLRRVRSHGELELEHGEPVAVVGVFQDITDSYHVQRSLRESASIDDLTRIANRAEFNRVLEAELQAVRTGSPLVLVLIDLDMFKTTNDTFGHLAGDDVLRAVGERLRAPFLRGSFAARLGGDEFALVLTDPGLVDDAPEVIDQLLQSLKQPARSQGILLEMSGTIGSAHPGGDIQTMRELLHAADLALYTAKRSARGSARVYIPPHAATG